MTERTHKVVYLLGPEHVELRRDPLPQPGAGEIVVRIGAATTCGTDVKVFRRGGHPRMLRPPTPFGHEIAGSVAAVGEGVSGWVEGDRVVVSNSAPCGFCGPCRARHENLCTDLHYLNGAFAEYILVPERFVERSTYRLDGDTPFPVAALTEPLACVLHGVDQCDFESPEDVALYGAGPIGLLFVAVLNHLGQRVTVADPNPPRLEIARALGAKATVCIDRGGGQAGRLIASSDTDGFAVVIDATGVPAVWLDALESVRPGGLVNLFGGCAPGTSIPLDTHRIHYSEITVKGVYHHRPDTVRRALQMLSGGAFDASLLLSATRPLEETEEALRSMMRKEALKVVLRSEL